jgi:hypothetical protein
MTAAAVPESDTMAVPGNVPKMTPAVIVSGMAAVAGLVMRACMRAPLPSIPLSQHDRKAKLAAAERMDSSRLNCRSLPSVAP